MSNECANTFPGQIIYSSNSTKHLTFLTGLLHQSLFTTLLYRARHDDPALLADKTNAYQIDGSREIIEQTIRGFVDYKFIVLLIVCTLRK